MRKALPVIILSLTLMAVQIPYLGAEIKGLPSWVDELQSNVAQAFYTKVEMSRINNRDYIEGKEYTVIRLQGEGSLKKVSDPFEAMRKLFPTANGWKEDLQYAADGHGSSSFAFRKESYFCIASVWIDSSCDDEETKHIPSKFWFSIDCQASI
ncbi:MAG: hypothetical protein KOO64_08305, partial [Desulfobacterales bacterium]|nr:hypothetical protein [Desulfobacterales bacterium]